MNTDNVIPFPTNPGAGGGPPRSPQDNLAALLAAGGNPFSTGFGSWVPQQPELLKKRRSRAAFVVRVDLDDAEPPIWRRLRLASDMTLDRLHDVLQITMGWTDSHLHHFVMGPTTRDRYTQHFLQRTVAGRQPRTVLVRNDEEACVVAGHLVSKKSLRPV